MAGAATNNVPMEATSPEATDNASFERFRGCPEAIAAESTSEAAPHMKSLPISNAALAVFGTPRLLKRILLRVNSPITILLSKRVCTAFRDAVQGSTRIHKKIFATPLRIFGYYNRIRIAGRGPEWADGASITMSKNEALEIWFQQTKSGTLEAIASDPYALQGSWRNMVVPRDVDDVHIFFHGKECDTAHVDHRGIRTLGPLEDEIVAWCRRVDEIAAWCRRSSSLTAVADMTTTMSRPGTRTSDNTVFSAGTTNTAALSAVLATTELLEMILLHVVEPKTILFSTQVCKAFRHTIQGSKELRGLVFLSRAGLCQLFGDNWIDVTCPGWEGAFMVQRHEGSLYVRFKGRASETVERAAWNGDDMRSVKAMKAKQVLIGSWRNMDLPSKHGELHVLLQSQYENHGATHHKMESTRSLTLGVLVDTLVAGFRVRWHR